ncbi:helix-turn-helix domain-containing protein [Paracidovorax konjaci]|uniref:Helix-turn-helix n=1 Tax=Paracidovorax konjaci TaxID=32040 RepID=A0A1I1U044_9BURK|nr:helix-turn-helix transcriptional regulator [Paracidovorax konjaci]SFD62978.1 Helix-turn-helix [Paracidovorax konjaci]
MKLTPFGEAVRVMRLKHGLSLKTMAEAMGISSAHLSSMEFGEKRLSQKHIDSAITFLRQHCDPEQIRQVRDAAEQSKQIIDTAGMSPEARGHLAAFARRLHEGNTPTPAILSWIEGSKKKS